VRKHIRKQEAPIKDDEDVGLLSTTSIEVTQAGNSQRHDETHVKTGTGSTHSSGTLPSPWSYDGVSLTAAVGVVNI
jgi:hypothetical protein